MEESSLFSPETEPPSTISGFTKTATRQKKSPYPVGNSLSPTQGSRNQQPPLSKAAPDFEEPARAIAFREKFFPAATASDWADWRWQIRHRICTLRDLERIVKLSDDERTALALCSQMLPMAITPYFASLLDPDNPLQPIRRTMIPVFGETLNAPGESEDPLHEEGHSPVQGLVHRYPDRVLFLVTSFCSSYCRYCTRSRMVGHVSKTKFSIDMWQKALDYIEKHTEVRDVLLSGGDPLTLADEKLEWLLERLREIKHVEIIRIGTKVPVVLPQRVTPGLLRMLKRYHPLWINVHFIHPDELTPETRQACNRLADSGIPLGSQTVLLKGINDDPTTMKALMHGLVNLRVRPYYLYQCDPITGSSHFRTPVEKGIECIAALRGFTSGFAVPTYVIDAPGGGGKIPISPQPVEGRDKGELLLRNFMGGIYRYPDYFQ